MISGKNFVVIIFIFVALLFLNKDKFVKKDGVKEITIKRVTKKEVDKEEVKNPIEKKEIEEGYKIEIVFESSDTFDEKVAKEHLDKLVSLVSTSPMIKKVKSSKVYKLK